VKTHLQLIIIIIIKIIKSTEVSDEYVASIFKVEKCAKHETSMKQGKWRRKVHPKRQLTFTVARTSSPTPLVFCEVGTGFSDVTRMIFMVERTNEIDHD
jgi:hypothetical protein